MKGVVLVLGEERFLAREAIRGILAAHPDLEADRFRGDATTPARVLDEVRTRSLLGKGRAIVVEEAAPLFEEGGLEAFAAYAARPVPGALLVLQLAKLDGRRKASKALAAAARTVRCNAPPGKEMDDWVGGRAREAYGLAMGVPAVRALRERIGDDLGLLDSALARLRDQVAPRKAVTADDITGSTDEQRSPILFEAANALEEGDLKTALRCVEAAFAEGVRVRNDVVTEPQGVALILLSNLHRAYVRLMRFRMLLEEGKSDAEAARTAGMPAFRAPQARRHRLDRLVAGHRHFVEADRALKRSEDEPRRILELLLVALSR